MAETVHLYLKANGTAIKGESTQVSLGREDSIECVYFESSVRTARVWILNDLFVAEHARRGGVARALLDAAADFARADGARGLMLETSRDNAPARALYRAAGWHEDVSQWYSLALEPTP